MAHGLPTINSVNAYPHMSLWGKIDPDGQYQDAYNRYAHIEVGAASSTSFEVMQSDLIMVHLTADDLKTLGVRIGWQQEMSARTIPKRLIWRKRQLKGRIRSGRSYLPHSRNSSS